MAENKPLSVVIDADISKLQKAISDVKDSIGQIASAIKNTDLGDFGKGLEQTLSQINTRLDQLEGNLQKTSTTAKTFTTGTKDARTALTSLSLVAQDLPFGFIAIQNNIPNLIQAFGTLKTESGGLKNALSSLLESLNGPAGVFLAFSVVTTAVTFAVQKYGSLGNAIDAIFSKNKELVLSVQEATKSYKEFNKTVRESNDIVNQETASTSGQIARIQALSDVIKNTNNSYSDRIRAIKVLKEENKDFFGQLSDEKINFEKLDEAVKNYTESIVRAAIIKGFEEDIVSTNKELVKQQKALNVLDEEVKKAASAPIEIRGIEARREDTRLLNQAKSAYNAQSVVVNELKNRISEYTNEINKAVKAQLPFIRSSEDNKNALNDEAKALDEAAKAAKRRAEQFKFAGDIRQLRNQDFLDFDPTLKPIKRVDAKGYAESFAKSINELPGTSVTPLVELLFPEEEFKKISGVWSKINADTAPKLEEFKNNIRDALISKELTTGVKTTYDDVEKAINDSISGIQSTLAADAQITQNFANAVMSGANEFARLQEQIKQFNSLKDSIENNLTRPFRSFFDDLLDNGKVSFDSFVELAKDAFKRIAAQAIASGLANLLAAVLSGGGSLALGKLGAAKKISSTLGFLGKTGGLFGSANFSGVSGGPLQMAGAVNLQLRGSDLVGSINRTNATINRIG